MHNIKANFDKVLGIVKAILQDECPSTGNFLRPGPKPIFTDLDVIALSITAECMGIDSELYLFSLLNTTYSRDFPTLITRRRFNDRRKSLFKWQERVRHLCAAALNEIIEVFAVDSMPLEVCKMARKEKSIFTKEEDIIAPDKGYCASQDKWYFGYKLHAACSPSGVVQTLTITKASVHDSNYLEDLSVNLKDCLLTGDRGYIVNPADDKALSLKEAGIVLEVPYRKNQKNKKPQLHVLKSIRKRIETVFSQLCDQFRIQRNFAHSFAGYRTRILSKISGMTILQFINKFITNKPVGQIKYALCY